MSFRLPRIGYLLAAVALLMSCPIMKAVDSGKSLSPEFRRWLNEDVTYIISSEERKQFLALSNDTERENFQKSFWASRNPDPGSEINAFEEEHYRRLAYVNEHYGNARAQNGWHTDQGMIYILLGEPEQVASYPIARNMRPLLIWFYESKIPALPTHFNIVFYKRSAGEAFALYSPYQDGPVRLVTGMENLNDQEHSLDIIRRSLGNEVARTTLSLIPTEPVDVRSYAPSMSSDVLLSTIRGLADNPLEKQRRELYRSREQVTASVFFNSSAIDVVTMAARDALGRETVSYLVRNQSPNAGLIGEQSGKGPAYNMTLRTVVATTTGKPVYAQQEMLQGQVTPEQAELDRKRRFAAEGRLPLVPGDYDVEVTLTNNLNLEAQRWRNHIEVPAVRSDRLGLSNLLVYTAPTAIPDPDGRLPFSLAGLQFPPRATQTVAIHPGDKVPLIFQIWLPKPKENAAPVKIVHLHYLYGSVAAGGKPLGDFDEDVDASNADAAGNLVTGHTIATTEVSAGNYQVVVKATADGYPTPAFSTLTLRVVPTEVPVDAWTASGPVQSSAESADDLKRGLAAEALGRTAEAEGLYRQELKANPNEMRALIVLAALLSTEGKTAELAKLGDLSLLASAVPPETLMSIAGGERDSGDAKKAIRLLTAQLDLQPPSAPVYELLASLYEGSGDTGKAKELREQAKKFSAVPTPKQSR